MNKVFKPKVIPELKASSFTLSMLIEDYILANQQKWRVRSRMEVVYSVNLSVEVIGDVRLEEVSRERLKECKSILLKLPANFSKSPKYRGIPVAKIITMSDVKPMTPLW